MASAPKLVNVDRRRQSPLTPELKEFIDRAIVPALVKQYLAEDTLANRREDEANSHSRTAAPGLEIVRP
jgi:hypothetical protein